MERDAEAGFTAFVEARGLGLLRFATALTGDRHLAEDLLQGALERVYGKWERVNRRGDPEWYVRRSIVNAARDSWRKRNRSPELTGLADGMGEGSYLPFDEVITRDTVRRALAELPSRQRVVIVLRYWEGLTEAETAELMGTSVGTVKSQGHRAMRSLREHLSPADGPLGAPTPAAEQGMRPDRGMPADRGVEFGARGARGGNPGTGPDRGAGR